MLKASVGKGAVNKQVDVEITQQLLNKFHKNQAVTNFPLLAEDGRAGSNTNEAIGAFQGQTVGAVRPDYRVNVGGTTLRELINFGQLGGLIR